MFKFEVNHQSQDSSARAGTITINGHSIHTPIFMPVGTQASVKSLTPKDLEEIGAEIILANTYHLYLRPGADTIAQQGGLHNFTGWHKPFLTDSGGFQVFSLGYAIEHKVGKIANIFPEEKGGVLEQKDGWKEAKWIDEALSSDEIQKPDKKLAKIDEEGVTFTSHLDGSKHRFNSEVSIHTQHKLCAHIIVAFDECPSPLHDYEYNKKSLERTHRWEKWSLDVHKALEVQKQAHATTFKYPYPHAQYLFGIPHGGEYQDLRLESAKYIASLDFDGFSIGGSLGKSKSDMHNILEWIMPHLGPERPRHLLGIGDIDDLFECIERGVDMFDCVAPSRIARNAALFISPRSGGKKENKFRLIITNNQFKDDPSPIDPTCQCYTCQNFSRSYLRHLFATKELLAYRLATIHNIYFIVNLSKKIRQSIIDNQFHKLKTEWLG